MNEQLESTFLEAIEQDQRRLLRVCSVYAEDEDDKKDLFQESLIQIWQSMPSFEGKSSLSTWMFRITLNVCLRLQSRGLKKRRHFINIEAARLVEIPDNAASPAEEQEQLVQLKRCIKKLDDADKAIIALYLEELPYRQISEVTGLTENNIAVRIKRIKNKLSTCITEHDDRR